MERTPLGFGLVALGGAAGAIARHGVDLLVGPVAGTFTVNVVGSLVLGIVLTQVGDTRVQLFLGTGVIASFTTYSTFAGDAVALGSTAGGLYVAASYGVGLAAAFAGILLGRRL